jgi:hypothetical protein
MQDDLTIGTVFTILNEIRRDYRDHHYEAALKSHMAVLDHHLEFVERMGTDHKGIRSEWAEITRLLRLSLSDQRMDPAQIFKKGDVDADKGTIR